MLKAISNYRKTDNILNQKLTDNYFLMYKNMLENVLIENIIGYSFSVRKCHTESGDIIFNVIMCYNDYGDENKLRFKIDPLKHQIIITSKTKLTFTVGDDKIRIPVFGTIGKFNELLRLVTRIKNQYTQSALMLIN